MPRSDDGRNDRDDEKNRDRARRTERPSRFSSGSVASGGASGGGGGDGRDRSPMSRANKRRTAGDRRVYVSNVAYEYRWQELKDLFRDEVGEVIHVELFVDENNKPRGCGIVEFDTPELAQKAVEKMHRYDLKGRKLVVKEDVNVERDKYGRIITGHRPDQMRNQPPPLNQRDDRPAWGNNSGPMFGNNNSGGGQQEKWGNMYGLSPQFLEYLGVQGPLVSKIFIANLDYKVDQKKLKEVFKLAGRIISCELSVDKDNKSRGFGVIEYSHPVEAVQAISMLNNQLLFDRRVTVRFDRAEKDGQERLPEGLKGIGMGLGSNGAPLKDVANNLPSLSVNSNINNVVQNMAAVPSPFATAASALGQSAVSLGVTGNQLSNALVGGTGLTLGNTGLERLMDSAVRRPLDMGALSTASGIASLMGSAPGGGGGNLGGLGGSGSNFGAGLGNNAFGNNAFGANQLSSQNNFLNNAGGNNLGNDFDTLSAALTGGFNNQSLADRGNRNMLSNMSSGLGQSTNNSNTASNRMTDAVIVRNLPPNVTWQQLKDKFGSAGNVKYAEMRGKDVGLVQYSTQWDANRAINLHDRTRWDGRNIEVSFY